MAGYMDASLQKGSLATLGQRIRNARKERGLTQEALAGVEFTKGYVSALERGAVRPSLKALEVFARRLDVPITEFLSAEQPPGVAPDVAAIQEDVRYQTNYIKMLIRTNKVDEALQLLAQVEQNMRPYADKLPANLRYLVSFLRGRAFLQQLKPDQARPELEAALEMAKDDEEASARVHNLLGVIFYEKGQPQFALQHHLECFRAVQKRAVKDPNFRVSVYRNLANDYWALRDFSQAIGVYKEALGVLQDLNDLERQAQIFWGMAMAYREVKDWPQAKLAATRALHIFEAADNRSEAASICLHLAEILLDEKRFAEAEELLARAKEFLVGTGNQGLLSFLYRDQADLALRQGQLEQATKLASQSVKSAEVLLHKAQSNSEKPDAQLTGQVWLNPIRAYAEALHIMALVEEAHGHREEADKLFQEALEQIKQTKIEETIKRITFSYAETLNARGDYKQAMEYYRAAAQSDPRPAPIDC